MKRSHIVAAILAMPWALMPEHMNAMAAVIGRWHAGIPATPEQLAQVQADREARSAAAAQPRAGGGAIAVINVFGVLTQRGNLMDELCGGGSASVEQLTAQLRSAEADNTVGQILLNFNTPGGSVYGIQELGAEINRIKAAKPIIGVANSLCASAGYWLMSQCSECYVTPGGEVGSIGVWQAHVDLSKALEMSGEKVELISAGRFKVEGNPYGPLDDEARAFMQQRTDDYYGAFTQAVAKGRGVPIAQVRDGMGQGRVLGAKEALDQNMVDGIATFDDVVKKMQRDAKAGGSAARADATAPEMQAAAVVEPVIQAQPAATSASVDQPAVPVVDGAALAAARRREIEILGA